LKILLAISKAIDWLTERVGGIMAVIVVLTIIVGFANAFLRKLSGAIGQTLITNQLIQAQWYLFSLLFLLGFPYILKHNVNVRVDFLYAKWGPRQRALVDFIGTLLFLIVFCLIGLYTAWGPVLTSFGRLPDGSFSGEWEVSADAGGLPIAPLKAFILVGFALMLLQAFSQLIKYLVILNRNHDPALDAAVMKAETDQAMAEELAEQLKAKGKI
jgi:TRAP-type mannitol/chloroaromatic compound transport system permease small subunit